MQRAVHLQQHAEKVSSQQTSRRTKDSVPAGLNGRDIGAKKRITDPCSLQCTDAESG
jgi:hypothetical protein